MSEPTLKTSMKKGFKAPIMKDNVNDGHSPADIADNVAQKAQKKKKENKKKTQEIDENSVQVDEKQVLKQNKKKTQETDENSVQVNKKQVLKQNKKKDGKVTDRTKPEKKLSKPQTSLSDSQYEDIFDAVLKGRKSNLSSQNNSPNEEILAVNDETTSLNKSKEKRDECMSIPATPVQNSKILSQVSPWGSHFSKQASQGSSILKELSESQSTLINSSTTALTLSSSSSSSDDSSQSLQHSVCALPQQQPRENQRKVLEELQRHRNVGVWVYCSRESCQKQRYLPIITDPQDLPDVWFCHLNPDPRYNSCQSEEQRVSAEEEEDMIYNSFTAGSVAWARVPGYPWWPAMVDDDPDLAQYYWLKEDFVTVTHYHVVFFDEGPVTRAWVDLKSISPYARLENKFKQRTCRGIDFSRRIQVAKQQANNALTMTSHERLTVYSFIARYKGPINTSDQKVHDTMKKYKLKSKEGSSQMSDLKVFPKKDSKLCLTDDEVNIKKGGSKKKKNSSIKRKQELEDLEKSSVGIKKAKKRRVNTDTYTAEHDIRPNEDGESLMMKCKPDNMILKTSNIRKKPKGEAPNGNAEVGLGESSFITKKNIQNSKFNDMSEQESKENNDNLKSDDRKQIDENHTENDKEHTENSNNKTESETPSIIEESTTNKLQANCFPSNQTSHEISGKNESVPSESETASFIHTEPTIDIVEPSQLDMSQESKHSLSQITIADLLAAESEDGVVPEMTGFSQSSQNSLPFEE